VNRKDLQTLSGIRLKEAKALFDLGLYSGSYYLAGYAVECALKACIAKKTGRYDFPDPALVKNLFVHGPKELLAKANLSQLRAEDAKADLAFRTNWDIVERWSPESRYTIHSREEADLLVTAVASARHGVISWIKQHW
jgi:HEPN domain-containing protein